MNITLPTKAFRTALSFLQPVTTAKASLPQLGAVIIKRTGSTLSLTGTNLDVWMTLSLACEAGDDESFSVPSEILFRALGRIKEDQCTLKFDEVCTLSSGHFSIKLAAITEPMIEEPSPAWGDAFTVELLPNLFHKLLPFASTDSNREVLRSIHMANGLMEACSGRMFCSVVTLCKGDVVVPAQLARLVAAMSGAVKCRTSESMVEFSGEGWVIRGKTIEGNYPDTEPFRKKAANTEVRVNRRELIEACECAALPLSKQTDGVWARSNSEELRVHSPGRAEHSASSAIAAKVANPIDFAFSASEMSIAMRALDADEVAIEMDVNPFLATARHGNTLVGCSLMRLET